MTDELPAKPKQTLAELYAKIANVQSLTADQRDFNYRHLQGKRKAHKFAVLYIKHNFRAGEAYREFLSGFQRRWTHTSRATAMLYASSKWVAHYVREIVQSMTTQVATELGNDLDDMLHMNRMLIHADICNLVEQANVWMPPVTDKDGAVTEPGRWQRMTMLKPLSELTMAERMSVKKMTFHKTGELASIESYSRLEAERVQIELLEILNARGGSDTDWMKDMRERLGRARKLAIDYEITRSQGKVVKLGAPKSA